MANPRVSAFNFNRSRSIHPLANNPQGRLDDAPKQVDRKSAAATPSNSQKDKPKSLINEKEVERINEMRAKHLPSTSCPLTSATFVNPVMLASGHTYEDNAAFRNHIEQKGIDPLTRMNVTIDEKYDHRSRQVKHITTRTVNYVVKKIIAEYNENVVKEVDELTKSNQELKAQNEALKKQLAEVVEKNQAALQQPAASVQQGQPAQQIVSEQPAAQPSQQRQHADDMTVMLRLVEAQANEAKQLTQRLEEQSKKFAEILAKKDNDVTAATKKMTELVERYQSLGTAVIDTSKLITVLGVNKSAEQILDNKSMPVAALSKNDDKKAEVAQQKTPGANAAVAQQITPDKKVEITPLNLMNANVNPALAQLTPDRKVEIAQQNSPAKNVEIAQEKVQVSPPQRHPQNQPEPHHVANNLERQDSKKQEELDLLYAQELQFSEEQEIQQEQVREPVAPRRYPPPQSFFIPSQDVNHNSGRSFPPELRVNQLEQYEDDIDDNNGGEVVLDLAGHDLQNQIRNQVNPMLPGVDYKNESGLKEVDKNFLEDVHCEFTTLAKMQLERGANVNVQDKNGNTAMHLAAQLKNPAMIKMLLEFKPNLEAVNKKGECPLDSYVYSTKGGAVSIEIVNLLRKNRSDAELLRLLNVNASQGQEPQAAASAAAAVADQKSAPQSAVEPADQRVKRKP